MAEKNIEFGDMAAGALTTKLKENETQLFNLKLQNSLGKLENTAQVRQARRDIARMKTVLRAKHLKSVAK